MGVVDHDVVDLRRERRPAAPAHGRVSRRMREIFLFLCLVTVFGLAIAFLVLKILRPTGETLGMRLQWRVNAAMAEANPSVPAASPTAAPLDNAPDPQVAPIAAGPAGAVYIDSAMIDRGFFSLAACAAWFQEVALRLPDPASWRMAHGHPGAFSMRHDTTGAILIARCFEVERGAFRMTLFAVGSTSLVVDQAMHGAYVTLSELR